MTSSKKPLTSPNCVDPHKKYKPKTCQFFKIETARLPASLERLNSSLPLSAGELYPVMGQRKYPKFWRFGTSRVKRYLGNLYFKMCLIERGLFA